MRSRRLSGTLNSLTASLIADASSGDVAEVARRRAFDQGGAPSVLEVAGLGLLRFGHAATLVPLAI